MKRHNKTRVRICAMAVALLAAGAVQSQTWATRGTISYDGAGNVTAMGADGFVYDSAGAHLRWNLALTIALENGSGNAVDRFYDAQNLLLRLGESSAAPTSTATRSSARTTCST